MDFPLQRSVHCYTVRRDEQLMSVTQPATVYASPMHAKVTHLHISSSNTHGALQQTPYHQFPGGYVDPRV